jgi:hypothetical protein
MSPLRGSSAGPVVELDGARTPGLLTTRYRQPHAEFDPPGPRLDTRDGRVRKRREAGPGARLSKSASLSPVGYQEPLDGQPPLPDVEQVRTAAPPAVFLIVKTFPDFEVVAIV